MSDSKKSAGMQDEKFHAQRSKSVMKDLQILFANILASALIDFLSTWFNGKECKNRIRSIL